MLRGRHLHVVGAQSRCALGKRGRMHGRSQTALLQPSRWFQFVARRVSGGIGWHSVAGQSLRLRAGPRETRPILSAGWGLAFALASTLAAMEHRVLPKATFDHPDFAIRSHVLRDGSLMAYYVRGDVRR